MFIFKSESDLSSQRWISVSIPFLGNLLVSDITLKGNFYTASNVFKHFSIKSQVLSSQRWFSVNISFLGNSSTWKFPFLEILTLLQMYLNIFLLNINSPTSRRQDFYIRLCMAYNIQDWIRG